MDKPIFDPDIPYVGPIGGGGRFIPQKLIRIQGTVPGISYRFNINLQCGPCTSPQDDIALQISVRLLDGCICLNSLRNGIWDEEQRKSTVPIKRAERFEIVILCEFKEFKVAINGHHYCEFPQRIHYDKISHLSIDGDVSIVQITYESSSGTSGAGVSAPKPSFPVQVAPIANESDDFEIIDNSTAPPPINNYGSQLPVSGYPPQSGIQSHLPQSGFHPPQAGFQPLNSGYQPPTSGFYPSSTPGHPSANSPYQPSNPNIGFNNPPSYEETLGGGAPYPTYNAPGYPQPMQPTYVSGMPVTNSHSATIPLNAVGSNFRPVKRDNTAKTCLSCCGAVFIIIVIILAIVFSKIRKSSNSSHYHSSYDDDNSYSSYNNNNNYWQNN